MDGPWHDGHPVMVLRTLDCYRAECLNPNCNFHTENTTEQHARQAAEGHGNAAP